MKKTIYFLILILTACQNQDKKNQVEQKNVRVDSMLQEQIRDSIDKLNYIKEEVKSFKEFKQFKIYTIYDTIEADFNGDTTRDKMFISHKDESKKLIFIDGITKQQTIIGKGKTFDGILDDLSWVDFWGTTTDQDTEEVTVEDGELGDVVRTKLDNVSLFFRKLESGGGVVTYDKKTKKFIWIHQSC
jgi:hypothetical protein